MLLSLFFVRIFPSRFAFRPVLLYLCTGKGSTRVLPFFILPPQQSCHPGRMALQNGPSRLLGRPKQASKCGPFAWSFGPNGISPPLFLTETAGIFKSAKRWKICRVSLFLNLSKFRAVYGIISLIRTALLLREVTTLKSNVKIEFHTISLAFYNFFV